MALQPENVWIRDLDDVLAVAGPGLLQPGEAIFSLREDAPLRACEQLKHLTRVGDGGYEFTSHETLDCKVRMKSVVVDGVDNLLGNFGGAVDALVTQVDRLINIMKDRIALPDAAVPFCGTLLANREQGLGHNIFPSDQFDPVPPYPLQTDPEQLVDIPADVLVQIRERLKDIVATRAHWRWNLQVLEQVKAELCLCENRMNKCVRSSLKEILDEPTLIGSGYSDPRFLYALAQTVGANPDYPTQLPNPAPNPN